MFNSIAAKAIVLALAASGAAYYQHQKSVDNTAARERAATQSFVDAPPLRNVGAAQVVILAPENCTRTEARRADELERALAKKGIAYTRSNRAEFTFHSSTGNIDAERAQAEAILRGDIPIVFVRGRAKANPSAEEVVEELAARRT